jgi:hypothetical protein
MVRVASAVQRHPVWGRFSCCRVTTAALVGALSVSSCSGRRPEYPQGGGARAQSPIPTRVRLREAEDHPRVSLVERLGDPSSAVAVAVAHDLGSVPSTALGAWLEARLAPLGLSGLGSRPHELGFEVRALVNSAEQASNFIRKASAALNTPVEPGEPGVALASERVGALRARTWSGKAEARLAACSGELGVLPGSKLLLAEGRDLARLLEGWRHQIVSAKSVAFAVLGTSDLLEAASEALAATRPWRADSSLRDPWPSEPFVGVEDAPGPKRLSVAVRVGDGAAAVAAARELGQRGSALVTRLSALPFDWKLHRVVGTTRPRGACLRLDLESQDHDATPTTDDVARASFFALEEASRALRAKPSSVWTLEQSVLDATDPRDATAIAAWRTLGGRLPPGPRTYLVHYQAPGAQKSVARALEHKLNLLKESQGKAALDVVARVEPGQGEVWLLLASPCGTYDEASSSAGSRALMLQAMGEQGPVRDVSLEPWVTPDGVGLLAHGPRLGPDESAEAQAKRIASVLGRTLVGGTLHGNHVASARARLLGEIGPEPKAAYWQALELAQPGRLSWLEPRGSWRSITDLAPDALETRRREWLSAPLRLAVLANWNDQQVAAAREEMERWLGGLGSPSSRCSSLPASIPKSGIVAVEPKERSNGTAAYVVVSLPGGLGDSRLEAEWTTYLLSRPSGWLERALGTLPTSTTAEARLLGGRHAAVVLVEVRTQTEQAEVAVAQVRGVLERLGRGGLLEARDVEAARRAFERWKTESQLDPRRRLVDLWQGAHQPSPDRASLRRFQERAFGAAPVGVVMVKD